MQFPSRPKNSLETIKDLSGVHQHFLYCNCHSGLDPESSISELESAWSLPRWGSGQE
jgi:hypothetical protein